MPAERRSPEPLRVVDQEEHELERVREAYEVELGRCGERHGRVVRVDGAAEAGVGGALRGHEQMCAPAACNFQDARLWDSYSSSASCSLTPS